MKINVLLSFVCALSVGYASSILLIESAKADRNFDRRLSQQRLFMQVALALSTPQGCHAILGSLIETWDRTSARALPWKDPAVRLRLVPGPSVEVQLVDLRLEIPLNLPACELDQARARYEIASYVTAAGGQLAGWAGFVRRCAYGQFLTRQPDPYQFYCLDLPP